MITANQFFQDSGAVREDSDNDAEIDCHESDLDCRWHRVSNASSAWRMERGTPPSPSTQTQQVFNSMDHLLVQQLNGETNGDNGAGSTTMDSDRDVLELEVFLKTPNFSAKEFQRDRQGVMISAPLRLSAKTLTKSLLEPGTQTFCLAAMTPTTSSVKGDTLEFTKYSGNGNLTKKASYVPAGYEDFEALQQEQKENGTSGGRSTVYYLMEIKKIAVGPTLIMSETTLEDIYVILDNPAGHGDGGPKDSSKSAGGLIKAKLVSSATWMDMIQNDDKNDEDGDLSWVFNGLEEMPSLSLPQPVESSWNADAKLNGNSHRSMLLIVSLDETSLTDNHRIPISNGSMVLKFSRHALTRHSPMETQLSTTHFCIGRGVQIIQHASSEQEDILKALEGALWNTERFIPEAKRQQWEHFPDVLISVLPHPALPYNIAHWLRDPMLRKSIFDPSLGNIILHLTYWQHLSPPSRPYVDTRTMLNETIWRDIFSARNGINQTVQIVRENAKYYTIHQRPPNVVDARELELQCRKQSVIPVDYPTNLKTLDKATLQFFTGMELAYLQRMLTALAIERLRCYEDMKKHDMFSVHWKNHTVEIPPPMIPEQVCPKCNPGMNGTPYGRHCAYHMAQSHYEEAMGRSPRPGMPIPIIKKAQLERLPHLLSMFPGMNLIVKLTVPGVAEDFPLISIGDLVRLHFSTPGPTMLSTEIIGEVADVVVKTEEVTLRLPSPFQGNITMNCLPYLQALLHTYNYVLDALPILQAGIPPAFEAQRLTNVNRKEILDRFRFDVRFGFQGGRGFDIILQVLHEFFNTSEPTRPVKGGKRTKQKIREAMVEKEFHLHRLIAPTFTLVHGIHRNDNIIRPSFAFVTPINAEQQKAVSEIVLGRNGAAPYIINGPAGTGKSMCVVETIIQVLRFRKESKILVCAPSDAACDVLAGRLISLLPPKSLLRINWWSRNVASVKPELLTSCPMSETGGLFIIPPLSELQQADVIVCQCFVAECLELAEPRGWTKTHFTHLFIDETSQAMECEALVPMAKVGAECSIVLAGDTKQLGPSIRDPVAASMGLGLSIQERLSNLPLYKSGKYCVTTRLVRNYRSNEAMLTVPSTLFYAGSLQSSAPKEVTDPFADLGDLGPAGFPLLLCNVPHGKERSKLDTPSFFNLEEGHAIVALIKGLLTCKCKEGVEPLHTGQICVITPFRAQVLALRMLLRGSNLGGVSVGVVEDYQGQERKVVFISTVLTQDHQRWNGSGPGSTTDGNGGDGVVKRFGFLHDAKKFNVAITRAHALCVVVGNADFLERTGTYWSALIDHIRRNDGILGDDDDHDHDEEGNASNEDDLYGVADLLRRVDELQLLGSGVDEDMHDLSYYYSDIPNWKVMLS